MTHTQAPLGSYPQSPDPTLSDPQWLQQLSSHPIFTSSRPSNVPSASSNSNAGSQIYGSHTRLMAVRGTDLIVVVDNQVRVASLVDAKVLAANHPLSPSPSSSFKSTSPASYKVLVPAQHDTIDFDIRYLSINPTGKLLACVGDSQITLLVLPRSGYTKHVDREIVCRTIPVAPYYHSSHSDAAVSKVDWHPWGESGTSLLVLTEDGLLREYDVARDTEEPQQTASFLPLHNVSATHHSRSRSATPSLSSRNHDSSLAGQTRTFGVSAADDDATTAVSFSLCVTNNPQLRSTPFDQDADHTWADAASRSSGPSDWSPLTVFGLMRNGDVWALCPFLPKSATVPSAYIHNLAKLASYHANTSESQHTSHVDTQLRYVKALLKQASKGSPQELAERQGSVTPGPERFARSRSTSTMDLDQLVASPGAAKQSEQAPAGVEHVGDGPVRLHPPSWSYRQDISQGGSVKKAPRPQGPFLLKPAPVELCDERESVASDVIWSWLTDESADTKPAAAVTGVAALSIVGHDGRMDVALLLESVEASWDAPSSNRRNAARRQSKPPKTNRYGLSDTEDEADEFEALTLEDPEELPTLLIYETIDLGLLDTALDSGISSQAAASDLLLSKMGSNKPSFVRDPLYGDALYVYHAFGAHCLGFATWVPKLIEALNMPSQDELDNEAGEDTSLAEQDSREQALVKMLHHGYNTEVVWVVNTVAGGKDGKVLEVNPVTGVSILSDVYLSYAFLAVTTDLQLVGVELSLRIEQDELDPSASRGQATTLGASDSSSGTKQYISLLGDGPAFQPPAIFAQSAGVQGLPQHPRRAALSGAATKSELQITPELLRALGKTVETYRHEIRDVVSAGNAVQARLDLQVREMTRQLEKLNTIRLRCQELGTKGTLGERVQKLAATQLQLVARIDKALQRLMDSHQPSLSMYEKKWFEELERIAAEVGVSRSENGEYKVDTRANRKALSAKAELLSHQLSLLRPQMAALREERPREGLLGGEQLKRVEKLLSSEAAMLAEAKDKVNQLNKRIAHIKPLRDSPAVGGGAFDADSSLSFSQAGIGSVVGGGLPTSSTAANFADFSISSRASPLRTHSRTGSSFFA
ncbi:hypothetical protein EX895_000560 [Sporisorium graminicola]|uniref:Uncharacterized protein n=1 Tax=Sporisorium graminicola TaxID=280036 RepID=A0A4U7L521_9BASI|nr:hypothetical protein EX895_000560 [Sporisorium graminicola]TKY90562.1 hypothetical protein EX895_000560 [Sporisorium graminicola]